VLVFANLLTQYGSLGGVGFVSFIVGALGSLQYIPAKLCELQTAIMAAVNPAMYSTRIFLAHLQLLRLYHHHHKSNS
jgi:membrane-bound ClpP family serine protease